MTASTSLLEMLLNLLRDPSALAAYRDDPEGFLSSCGDVSPSDVHDALVQLQDNQDADFSREYNTGGNHISVPPPPPAPEPLPGESDHEAAVRYLNTYVTENHIDDRDVIVDNSLNQQIDTGGGDFEQDVDIDSTVAAGDGSVAAGEDIEDSNVVTGDDNTIGDGNIDGDGNVTGDDNETVNGDDNTTSFGEGDSTSAEIDGDVNLSDGSSFGIGGSSSSETTDNSREDSGNTSTETSYDDSFNDNSRQTETHDNSVGDSFNESSETSNSSEYDIEDSYNSSTETTEDSHNSTQETIDTQVV